MGQVSKVDVLAPSRRIDPVAKKDPLLKTLEDKPAPTVAPPALMPTIDDEAVRKARKRAIEASQQRGGRASTILSEGSDRLG